MSAQDTRDKICEAAIRTASRDGLLAMTLDNVAKEAGISKGGMMYHFPSKEELVKGMLEYFSNQLEQMILQRVAEDPQPRFRWARTMVSCFFPEHEQGAEHEGAFSPDVMDRFMLTLLAAAVNSPGLIEPLRQVGRRFSRRLLSDPQDGLEQLLFWLMMDGLFLWQFVGLISRDEPLYDQICAALRAKVAERTTAVSVATSAETRS